MMEDICGNLRLQQSASCPDMRCEPLSDHSASFIHERVIERALIGGQCACFESEFLAGFTPGLERLEDFAEDLFGLGGIQGEACGDIQRGGDAAAMPGSSLSSEMAVLLSWARSISGTGLRS